MNSRLIEKTSGKKHCVNKAQHRKSRQKYIYISWREIIKTLNAFKITVSYFNCYGAHRNGFLCQNYQQYRIARETK